ncbi:TPA: PLP-dependent transferase, partial [Mannheimia haemolytica]|nr:PLP-dependent transferase [Mannheimia haemolytica]
ILANQPEEIAKIRPSIERKLTGTLIRIHVGLEAVEDLIADLEQGFNRIR